MSDTTVKLQIKVTGSNSFKEVEVSANELAKAIDQVKGKTDQLSNSLINSNQMAQAFEQVSSAVQGLQSAMHGLTDAYAVQAQAETRLATVMRNTMDATDAEIQSIKDLASAQQQLGVVGDEVQLSGAQELATYLGKKESLEKLIPVMNDMIAQQYGYNATAESAVVIATMMGKVMEGQTKALSRYGYSFTEAQEEILKFGTEEERAATLAEVIEQSVGGVNAALAATPYGKIVQANNKFGDLKETLGRLIAPSMEFVDKVARISIAVAGLGKGIATLKSLGASIRALGFHSKVTAAAQRMLGAAGITAAAGTKALRLAVTALYASMTLGLSLAIQALVEWLTRLIGKTDEAAESVEELDETMEAFKNAAGQAKAEIEGEIAALKRLIDSNNDTSDAVKKLNDRYGEIFGSHQTASEWYDILTKKSEAYCRQLGYEAKAKAIASEVGDAIVRRDELVKEMESLSKAYTNAIPDLLRNTSRAKIDADESEFNILTAGWSEAYKEYFSDLRTKYAIYKVYLDVLNASIGYSQAQMEAAFGEAGKAADELKKGINDDAEAVSWLEMSYNQLGDAIHEQEKQVGEYSDGNSESAKEAIELLEKMRKKRHEIGVALGLEKENTKGVGGETEQLTGKLVNLKEINGRIAELQKKRLEATRDEIEAIDEEIARVQRLKDEFEGVAKTAVLIPELKAKQPGKVEESSFVPNTEKGFDDWISSLQAGLRNAPKEWRPAFEAEIARAEKLRDEFLGVKKEMEEIRMPSFSKAWNGIKGLGNSIRDIKDALTETDDAWDALAKTIDGFISLFQSIQSVVEIINNITAATKTMQAVKNAATQQEVSNARKELAANISKAGSGAAASQSSIPFVGPALAIAAVGSVLGLLSTLPKFANGAVVYGPTVGLMGEYAGASSNPEVIAPLNKLRGILGDGGSRTEVEFRIKGRELVGIMNKQTNIYKRSR